MPHKLILYKSENCPYCVNFKETWNQIKNDNKLKNMEYHEVDVDDMLKEGGRRHKYKDIDYVYDYAPMQIPQLVVFPETFPSVNYIVYEDKMTYEQIILGLTNKVEELQKKLNEKSTESLTDLDEKKKKILLKKILGDDLSADGIKLLKDMFGDKLKKLKEAKVEGGNLEQSGGASSHDNKNYKLKYYKYKAKYIKSKEN